MPADRSHELRPPKWVPQMADAEEVLARIPGGRACSTTRSSRTGRAGPDRAVAAGLTHVVTIMSASESHNTKNLNMERSSASLEAVAAINGAAASRGVRVRSYIAATAYGCPFEGHVPAERVADIAAALEEYGSYEISLGDTTGMAHPGSAFEVGRLASYACNEPPWPPTSIRRTAHRVCQRARLAGCRHRGLRRSGRGAGGCPYAGRPREYRNGDPGRGSALMGIETGIDRPKWQRQPPLRQGPERLRGHKGEVPWRR